MPTALRSWPEPHSDALPKTATLQDVASVAGVTQMTVSNVLREKGRVSEGTRESVLRAVRELNYSPNPLAQRLARGHDTRHIDLYALMLDGGVGVAKLKRIQNALMLRGYDVPVHSYDFYGEGVNETQRKAELMSKLRRTRPRAIVCATPGVNAQVLAELNAYVQEGGLAICYDDEAALAGCDNVVFDVTSNIAAATRHLLELGHRKIGLFDQGVKSPRAEILRGFEIALAESGLKARRQWLFGSHAASEEGGMELARDFLALKPNARPTAMIVINDHAALAFMVELGRSGVLVPRDLSVVGHDDLPVAKCCPVPLTSVSHPVGEIAGRVVEMLAERLENRYQGAARRVVLSGELVLRESTAAPEKNR